jgi:hypothetical protein
MIRRVITGVALCVATPFSQAGVFLDFDGQPLTTVVHPSGVTSAGGEIEVTVCLAVPPVSGDARQAIRNVVDAYNRDERMTGNIVPHAGGSDFESALMHELGHCIGMDHIALGPSEVGTSDFGNPTLYYANSSKGADNQFDVNDGADNVRGTRDDARDDDVNRVWYRKNVNDPWDIQTGTVDQTTYTMAGFLPVGFTHPEIATSFGGCDDPGNFASSSALRGEDPTQSVMFPVLCTSTNVRRMAPDDSATLELARAGFDGVAGNGDDYTVTLVYDEVATDCDIEISFVSGPGFAFCQVSATGIPGSGDISITTGSAQFESTVAWFFNQEDTTGPGAPIGRIFYDGFE